MRLTLDQTTTASCPKVPTLAGCHARLLADDASHCTVNSTVPRGLSRQHTLGLGRTLTAAKSASPSKIPGTRSGCLATRAAPDDDEAVTSGTGIP